MNNPVCWQHFVVGVEMVISSNINTDLGISNGTMGICHLIAMKEHSDTVYYVTKYNLNLLEVL